MTNYDAFMRAILKLPEDVQHIINMFNHSHRAPMKTVLNEMVYRYFPKQTPEYWRHIYTMSSNIIPYVLHCENCHNHKPILLINYEYCCEYCRDEGTYRYEEMVEERYRYEDDYY